jgi:UDP-N-acetylglucosamine 2-epimerase (non-hydrolysing)
VAVAGARPNFVKLAPLVAAARAAGRELPWVHTGQHADAAMARDLWEDLRLPEPVATLGVRPPGARRAERMAKDLVPVLGALRPSMVAVIGDVDSTVAGALAARTLGIRLAHVEAGLRSFERGLPEERNRVRVDALSDRLHCPEPAAAALLLREGRARAEVRMDGNVLADALLAARARIDAAGTHEAMGLAAGSYVVVTLHRQATVDDPARLARWMESLRAAARERPVVFPVHPRTRRALPRRPRAPGLRLVDPMPWTAFLGLVAHAAAVVTDSGGLQVETSLLAVPCWTARARTEHGLTLTHGTNRLLGADPRRVPRALADSARVPAAPAPRRPRAWDGRAASRIVADWLRWA